jgi:hypothetical protein
MVPNLIPRNTPSANRWAGDHRTGVQEVSIVNEQPFTDSDLGPAAINTAHPGLCAFRRVRL